MERVHHLYGMVLLSLCVVVLLVLVVLVVVAGRSAVVDDVFRVGGVHVSGVASQMVQHSWGLAVFNHVR
jgi:hypothetical protein